MLVAYFYQTDDIA